MKKPRLAIISGGIGAGKSVVSRILESMGYPVYDSDSRAKRLMDSSAHIMEQLRLNFGDKTVRDGVIDRKHLSAIVFNAPGKLEILNRIVHGAVVDDVKAWLETLNTEIAFVETALLYQSRLDLLADEVWEVTAPVEIRICRVISRNNMTEHQVRARIDSQNFTPENPHANVKTIVNDDTTPLLPQIERYLKECLA